MHKQLTLMKGGNHSDDGENASCPTAFGSVLRVPSTNAFAPYVSTHRCSPCAKPAPEYEMSCRSYLRTVSLTNSSTCVSLGGVLSSTGVTVPYGDCGKGSDGQLRSCQQAYGPREVLRVELPKELLLLESSSMLRLQDHCKEMIQRVAVPYLRELVRNLEEDGRQSSHCSRSLVVLR